MKKVNESKETVNISKETIKRLVSDVSTIVKNPLTDNGIYYFHDQNNMFKGYAMIIGPYDTPYENGYYFFELDFPSDYPHNPPKVTYYTNDENIRFNPNLYVSGKVCISILNTWRGEQWSGCQTISTLLLTLCTIFNKQPILNEPGVTKNHKDFDNYHKIIEYKNYDIAIHRMLCKMEQNNKIKENFGIFYQNMIDNFNKKYDKIISDLEKISNENNHEINDKVNISTDIYKMSNVIIDYKKIIDNMKILHIKLNNEKIELNN